MGICRSLDHSFFNFANLRFVADVTFFPIKLYKKNYFHGKFITESFLFLLPHMLSWMTKFLFTENNLLPRLIKQESYSSLHCIFQSAYALTRSTKILRRNVVRVLITLLIKQ